MCPKGSGLPAIELGYSSYLTLYTPTGSGKRALIRPGGAAFCVILLYSTHRKLLAEEQKPVQ
jgi:hypothetical protein